MARLKDRGTVLKRDDSFARRLDVAKPVASAPSVNKTDTLPHETKTSQTPAVTPKPAGKPPAKKAAPQVKQPSPAAAVAAPKPEPAPAARPAPPAKQPTEQMSETAKTRLRVAFRCPADLSDRAASWAKTARCPVSAVFRKAFSELRPKLIEQIEAGISYKDVPSDRMTEAPRMFDTSMMISQTACDRLMKEIDPEAMTGIEAPMSRWARAQFIPHFDAWLTAKGQ